MKWVVELSPAAVTWWSEKRRLCGSSAAVTQRRGVGWRWGAFINKSIKLIIPCY
ncbi:unnamed protein product [Spirodela intermedia]|uniref:Uncharacterized protein n=1 Tax=Spirodela intermedia TaxID=51605 RepID=A0A7I8IFX7_SPIIN|nr:unnamed protein product [Spirodela intermedia]CAA6656779.1 unnamed protein product [Spirodela intermedia]